MLFSSKSSSPQLLPLHLPTPKTVVVLQVVHSIKKLDTTYFSDIYPARSLPQQFSGLNNA